MLGGLQDPDHTRMSDVSVEVLPVYYASSYDSMLSPVRNLLRHMDAAQGPSIPL